MRGGGTETVAVVKQREERRNEGLFNLRPLGELPELRIVVTTRDAD